MTRTPPLGADEFRTLRKKAEALIEKEDKWKLIRGKWVLNTFASRSSNFKSGEALLLAAASAIDNLPRGVVPFLNKVRALLQAHEKSALGSDTRREWDVPK